MNKIRLFFALCLTTISLSAYSAKYYVSPTGNDANVGNIDNPFLTIQRAQDAVIPGDTVYIRGGKYMMTEAMVAKDYSNTWAYVTYLDKSGTEGHRINYWAYPSETPIFDYSNVKPVGLRVNAFQVNGSYIYIKGIQVVGVQVTILTHTQSECFENQGSNNIYEQLSMHDGMAIGFYLTKGANNLILNCDAYNNHDSISEDKLGGNTDGFGNHPAHDYDTANIYRGDRAWFNSDDGYDCISAHAATIFDHCWSFFNGYSTKFASLGDGNGFKGGGYGTTAFNKLPDIIPHNTIEFCLAVQNKSSGFYANHHLAGSNWFNNSAYKNAYNYNMLNRKADNETDYLTDVPGYDHVMRNNLGFAARGVELENIDKPSCDLSHDYFDMPLTVTTADFKSLDESLLTSPRQSDGSLPDIAFMKLAQGSDLIDAGIAIGFAYKGTSPDLGYSEYDASLPIELVGITANKEDEGISLSWETASEINNKVFEIERSSNSIDFYKIGEEAGAGNSSNNLKYSFRDNTPLLGENYYRLKQIDFDNNFTYSKVVIVNFNSNNMNSSTLIYPNPVNSILNLRIPNYTEPLLLDIYDLSGKVMIEKMVHSSTIQLNALGLKAGAYIILLKTSNSNKIFWRGKFTKQN